MVLPGFSTSREIAGGSKRLLKLEDLGKSGWETADFDGTWKKADALSERRARVALLWKMHRARLMAARSHSKEMPENTQRAQAKKKQWLIACSFCGCNPAATADASRSLPIQIELGRQSPAPLPWPPSCSRKALSA